MDQKKYKEAIAHLEEDEDNPFTLELLVQAYYQNEQPEKLHETEAKLRGTNVPTMEQALVVPAARAKRPIIENLPASRGSQNYCDETPKVAESSERPRPQPKGD